MQHFFEKIRFFFFYFDTYLFENKAGNKIYMVVCHIVFFLNMELVIINIQFKKHQELCFDGSVFFCNYYQ